MMCGGHCASLTWSCGRIDRSSSTMATARDMLDLGRPPRRSTCATTRDEGASEDYTLIDAGLDCVRCHLLKTPWTLPVVSHDRISYVSSAELAQCLDGVTHTISALTPSLEHASVYSYIT